MHTFTIETANIRCLIKSEEINLINLAKAQYKEFISHGKPDVEIRIEIQNNLDPAKYVGLADTDLQPNHGQVEIVSRGGNIFVGRFDFAGYIDTRNRKGEAVLTNLSGSALDSYLRACYSVLTVVHDGFLLHSAGVIVAGKGYIFCGPSGSGKTTIAKLSSHNDIILSDELIAIRKINGFYKAWGTPFYGDLRQPGTNNGTKIETLFIPKKHNKFYLRKLDSKESLLILLSNIAFSTKSGSVTKQVLDICWNFCENIPCYEMHFAADGSLWRFLNELDREVSCSRQ